MARAGRREVLPEGARIVDAMRAHLDKHGGTEFDEQLSAALPKTGENEHEIMDAILPLSECSDENLLTHDMLWGCEGLME